MLQNMIIIMHKLKFILIQLVIGSRTPIIQLQAFAYVIILYFYYLVELSRPLPGAVLVGTFDGGSLQLVLSCFIFEAFVQ